jgi:chemotaxis protein MotB
MTTATRTTHPDADQTPEAPAPASAAQETATQDAPAALQPQPQPAGSPPSDDPADDLDSVDGDSGGGAPAWIVTFADMMSLLLCFFVLLLSFSAIDAEKFRQAAESLKEAFKFSAAPTPGPQRQETTTTPDLEQMLQSSASAVSPQETFQDHLQQAKRDIDEYIDRAGLSKHIQTEISSNYLEIVNSNPLNFPPGKAELLESSLQYLNALIPILQRPDFRIIVEGHTDSIPISTTLYRSNWELSAARAASFVTYLEEHGVDPKRMVVHGYGPYAPVAPNDTEENRARNRRIEIMLSSAQDQEDLAKLESDSEKDREGP